MKRKKNNNYKKLRENLKEVKEWNERYTRENSILRRKLDIALDRLSTISCGMHYSHEVQDKWTNDSKLQTTASQGLLKVSKVD